MLAETSRPRWEVMLQVLVQRLRDEGLRRHEADAAALLQQFGAVRERLLAVMDGPDWVRDDGPGRSLASEARFLLALWGDPRDAALVDAVVAGNRWIVRGPPGVEGRTLEATLRRWEDDHFAREGVKDRRRRTASWVHVLARTPDWGLAEQQVRYRHWGYTNLVAVRRHDRRWRVHLVVQVSLDHFARSGRR